MEIKKRSRTVWFAIGTLSLFLLIGFFLINILVTPMLTRKIKSAVIKASNGLYRVNFSRLELHIL